MQQVSRVRHQGQAQGDDGGQQEGQTEQPPSPGHRPGVHGRLAQCLGRVRRKPAVGQRPVAYIYTRWYGDRVALWDPEQAAKMRPLSALQRRQMQQRRTCT
ncbi:hypothetical protein GCM10009579_66050 [Streptomyces javensis]|uniref:Uncharacterized protein n=1 Tax=Streptomyces javensis TaxID=114698 RepID=A0ABN1X8A4_9ACTN